MTAVSQLLKIEAPSFPLGLFSHHSVRDISLHKQSSFVGATIGTHIDSDISLLMPLRFVRQAVANEWRSRLYCSSSSALIGSPPCGSCSVCELKQTGCTT